MSREFLDLAYDREESPSRELRDTWPADRLLRACGWSVVARPKRGPALWRRGEVVLREAEALRRCRQGGG